MSDPIRTLIVDDNQGVRELLRASAELDGNFEVVAEAENAEVGIAAASWLRPSLVLLDISLPGMDGLTAYRHVREAAPDATVVLMTGFSGAELDVPDEVEVIPKTADLLFVFDRLREIMLA